MRAKVRLLVVLVLLFSSSVQAATAKRRCDISLQSLGWYEKVKRLADQTSLSRIFKKNGYRPPRRSYVLAARIVPGLGQPAFQYFSLRNTGFVYSPRRYWPASTIKIWAALNALITLRAFGLDGQAHLSMLDSYGWFQDTAYDLYKHLSNESYDRLMRIAGLKQVNRFAHRKKYGVPNIVLHRGYGGGGVRLSPRIRFQQAGKTGVIPRRYWRKTHPRCRRNCTTLLDLQEIVRRVVLHQELPLQERFPLYARDARRWRRAMKTYWKWVQPGIREALGADAQTYNKTGSVPGNHMLDNALVVSKHGRFLLTLAAPWPHRYYSVSLSLRELNELARQTLLAIRSMPSPALRLQADSGIRMQARLSLDVESTKHIRVEVKAGEATQIQVWLGKIPVPMVRKKQSFFGELRLSQNSRPILVVQAMQRGNVVGYRVFGTTHHKALRCP